MESDFVECIKVVEEEVEDDDDDKEEEDKLSLVEEEKETASVSRCRQGGEMRRKIRERKGERKEAAEGEHEEVKKWTGFELMCIFLEDPINV